MGMDIYGLNPKLTSEKPEIDWDTSTEESRKEYFKILDEWEEENPGHYFRASIWSWRPLNVLIDFVLMKKELDCNTSSFGENSGGGFKEQYQCDVIADGLEEIVEQMNVENQDNLYLNLGMWVNYNGTFNVPNEIQDQLNKEQKELFLFTPIVASNGELVIPAHSTSKKHIEEFVKFLRHCGGFEIY
jgi:hypothetical protein